VVDFTGATFGSCADFSDVAFGDYAVFSGVSFGYYAAFTGASFDHMANFENAIFHGRVDFTGKSNEQHLKDLENVDDMNARSRRALEQRYGESGLTDS
jgi:hypothetical protein